MALRWIPFVIRLSILAFWFCEHFIYQVILWMNHYWFWCLLIYAFKLTKIYFINWILLFNLFFPIHIKKVFIWGLEKIIFFSFFLIHFQFFIYFLFFLMIIIFLQNEIIYWRWKYLQFGIIIGFEKVISRSFKLFTRIFILFLCKISKIFKLRNFLPILWKKLFKINKRIFILVSHFLLIMYIHLKM